MHWNAKEICRDYLAFKSIMFNGPVHSFQSETHVLLSADSLANVLIRRYYAYDSRMSYEYRPSLDFGSGLSKIPQAAIPDALVGGTSPVSPGGRRSLSVKVVMLSPWTRNSTCSISWLGFMLTTTRRTALPLVSRRPR